VPDQDYIPRRKERRVIATIPQPHENLASLHTTAMATKEAIETMQGLRGDHLDRAVTWGDLVRLGVATLPDFPQD
jgi:hypothetical protein